MATISLHGMKFFAYHGCFEEEATIGTHFIVDLTLKTDTRKAQISDSIEDTVNYQSVYQTVKKEIKKRSHLLENIANRIIIKLQEDFNQIDYMEVTVHKMNPPLGQSEVESVSVTLSSNDVNY